VALARWAGSSATVSALSTGVMIGVLTAAADFFVAALMVLPLPVFVAGFLAGSTWGEAATLVTLAGLTVSSACTATVFAVARGFFTAVASTAGVLVSAVFALAVLAGALAFTGAAAIVAALLVVFLAAVVFVGSLAPARAAYKAD